MEYLSNMYFLLALTFVVYAASQILQLRTGWTVLNPILVSAVVIIAFLKTTGVSIETYNEGGRLIEFWLKPAVVALGVPLYKELSAIRKQLLPLLMSELAGCVVGIISVVLVARMLGATQEVVLSLAAKSVTTPIAMEVTHAIGGIPSLTAAVVICVGIFGGMTGFKVIHGYVAGNGRERQVWRVCKPRVDNQRHIHSIAHTHHSRRAGAAMTAIFQSLGAGAWG